MRIPERLKAEYTSFVAAPKWRRYLWLALAAFLAVYIIWLRFGPQPAKPGAVIDAPTSPKVADLPRKEVTPKKLTVYKDKKKVADKLKLPEWKAPGDSEEVFEVTDAPPSKYGTTTATFVNMSTGKPRSVSVVNKAPWFRFERGNQAGVEYGIGSRGRYVQGDYQRDVVSIKGVVLGVRAAVTAYPGEADARAGVRAEYRW